MMKKRFLLFAFLGAMVVGGQVRAMDVDDVAEWDFTGHGDQDCDTYTNPHPTHSSPQQSISKQFEGNSKLSSMTIFPQAKKNFYSEGLQGYVRGATKEGSIYVDDSGHLYRAYPCLEGSYSYCGLAYDSVLAKELPKGMLLPTNSEDTFVGVDQAIYKVQNGTGALVLSSSSSSSSSGGLSLVKTKSMPFGMSSFANNYPKCYKALKIVGYSAAAAGVTGLIVYTYNKVRAKDDKRKKLSVAKWSAAAGLITGVITTYRCYSSSGKQSFDAASMVDDDFLVSEIQ